MDKVSKVSLSILQSFHIHPCFLSFFLFPPRSLLSVCLTVRHYLYHAHTVNLSSHLFIFTSHTLSVSLLLSPPQLSSPPCPFTFFSHSHTLSLSLLSSLSLAFCSSLSITFFSISLSPYLSRRTNEWICLYQGSKAFSTVTSMLIHNEKVYVTGVYNYYSLLLNFSFYFFQSLVFLLLSHRVGCI